MGKPSDETGEMACVHESRVLTAVAQQTAEGRRKRAVEWDRDRAPIVSLNGLAATAQGLTLVHFSAQPEPFMLLKTSPKRLSALHPRHEYPLNAP